MRKEIMNKFLLELAKLTLVVVAIWLLFLIPFFWIITFVVTRLIQIFNETVGLPFAGWMGTGRNLVLGDTGSIKTMCIDWSRICLFYGSLISIMLSLLISVVKVKRKQNLVK